MKSGGGGTACGEGLAFRLGDPDRRLADVRLFHHAGLHTDRLGFGYDEADRAWAAAPSPTDDRAGGGALSCRPQVAWSTACGPSSSASSRTATFGSSRNTSSICKLWLLILLR